LGLGVSGPAIRGPRISLFPFKITGFRLTKPRLRARGASSPDPVTRAGASLVNRLITKLTRAIFRKK
jgi:hypothetical protein